MYQKLLNVSNRHHQHTIACPILLEKHECMGKWGNWQNNAEHWAMVSSLAPRRKHYSFPISGFK